MRHDYRYFVYSLNSSSRRALYTGVTNNLLRRVDQHRSSDNRSFTHDYRVYRLVYYEVFADVRNAIAREKEIKGWTRARKEALVASMNPQWRDLIEEWERRSGVELLTQGPSRKTTAQDDRG